MALNEHTPLLADTGTLSEEESFAHSIQSEDQHMIYGTYLFNAEEEDAGIVLPTQLITMRGLESTDVIVPESALALTASPESQVLMDAFHVGTSEFGSGTGTAGTSGERDSLRSRRSSTVSVGQSLLSDSEGVESSELQRNLTWYHLVPLIYFWTCGGPFGFEPTVTFVLSIGFYFYIYSSWSVVMLFF
jgi:hypothetical protein